MDHILTSKEDVFDPDQLINFIGQGSKDRISISLGNFLYGKAHDNYVELYYLENSLLKKFLIRVSLGKLVDSLGNEAIQRCHRSFMVNLSQVQAVKGSQHNFSLYLDPYEKKIPVSKSYQEAVMLGLKRLKNFR